MKLRLIIANLRWGAEITGVIMLAFAAAQWKESAGVAVVGVYLILLGMSGGSDAGSRTDD